MRKYGLIGYPLGHSFSQTYFTRKFISEKITDCSYENYPLTTLDLLPELLTRETDLQGLNVTIPYKSEVFRFIDVLDSEARDIGAVNVLKIRRSGNKIRLFGFNSDITGIYDSLSPYLNDSIKNALVLGTGGSSRAVCYVLRKFGLKVTVVSRKRGEGLIDYSEIDSAVIKKTGLIVNTTPLGMFPNTETRPDIDYSLLGSEHVLFDLVYNPEITAFLRKGEEQGCSVIPGLKMLHSQAEKAWEIWNNNDL
jgi:shikimate dehydrogenase